MDIRHAIVKNRALLEKGTKKFVKRIKEGNVGELIYVPDPRKPKEKVIMTIGPDELPESLLPAIDYVLSRIIENEEYKERIGGSLDARKLFFYFGDESFDAFDD